MADSVRATPIVIIPGETAPLGFNFTDLLSRGVNPVATIQAVQAIDVLPAGELTLGAGQPNAAEFKDEFERTVALNHGVTAVPSGAVAGQNYDVTVTVTDTDGHTRKGVFPVWARS
jgi:hypothetical protein